MRRRRQWKGKGEDLVKRKMKRWGWIVVETGRGGMAGGLSFGKRGDPFFCGMESGDGLWLIAKHQLMLGSLVLF